jgi:hypothetical protein
MTQTNQSPVQVSKAKRHKPSPAASSPSSDVAPDDSLVKHVHAGHRTSFVLLRCASGQTARFRLKGGSLQTVVLFGQIEVDGCELKRKQKAVGLYSTEDHPLIFTMNHDDRFSFNRLRAQVNKLNLMRNVGSHLLKNEQSFDGSFTLLLLRKTALRHYEQILGQLSSRPSNESIRLECIDKPAFSVSDRWADQLAPLLSNGITKDSVVMVCGGQNSGKSSVLRWISNRLLHSKQFTHLYYLDLDVGQPEFGQTAQVTLTRVSRPILTPPHVNVFEYDADALWSFSVGSVNVESVGPLFSANMLRMWNEKVMTLDRDAPILINTMGYVRTMGFSLIVDATKYMKPTHLIEIRFDLPPKSRDRTMINFTEPLKSELMNRVQGYLKIDAEETPHTYEHIELRNNFHVFYKNAFQTRLNNQLGYLCNYTPLLYRPLSALIPLKLSLSDLCFFALDVYAGAPHIISDIFSGSWVHLCSILSSERLSVSSSNPESMQLQSQQERFQVLSKLPENECFGSALVRNFDLQEGCVYLLSPISEDLLSKVNCLVKPGMMITPNEITLSFQEGAAALIPYVAL